MGLFEGRRPRLVWSALFLAYYACLYHSVLRKKGIGFLDFRDASFEMESLVLYRFRFINDHNGHVLTGEVCFPTIDRFYETFGLKRWTLKNIN